MDISFKSPHTQPLKQSIEFDSPWLHFERPTWPHLENDTECEVAVIGAGISGIATVYYLLTETNRNVILFEKGRVASQATGNNAGIACVHIEKPIQDLVKEYGLEKTRQSFSELDQAWELMISILDTIGAKALLLPFPTVTIALSSVEVLLEHLVRESYNRAFGRTQWQYYVLDDPEIKQNLSAELCENIRFVSREEILTILNVANGNFIGVAKPIDHLKLARLNSAKFCHLVLDYLNEHYPNRLSIFENTPISCIEQQNDTVVLKHPSGMVKAKEVVLCTNGYKNIEIFDRKNNSVDRLKNAIIPREGYMAGFTDNLRETYTQAFFDDSGFYADSPYFYLTHTEQLTIIGGPEFDQPDGCHTNEVISQRAASSQETYRLFLKNTYNIDDCSFSYFWYGIMGYTSNDLRWVGEEPQLKHLWYNLGCNGVGIVSAIGAGKRLVTLMQGESLPPSLFDVHPST